MKFKQKIESSINESIATKQALLSEDNIKNIEEIGKTLAQVIENNKKIIFCGNGGSAADSQHLAAELVVRLRSSYERPAIPAIALTVDTSVLTACGNDYGYNYIFSRQIEALAQSDDALIAISTSGNSENIIYAINTAKTKNVKIIGFLGGTGGKIKELCDYTFIAPSSNTARIQEAHITIGHILCEIIEEICYPKKK
jgi:D-sedoheptulose 7-phosphate isomerase